MDLQLLEESLLSVTVSVLASCYYSGPGLAFVSWLYALKEDLQEDEIPTVLRNSFDLLHEALKTASRAQVPDAAASALSNLQYRVKSSCYILQRAALQAAESEFMLEVRSNAAILSAQ